MLIVFYSFLDFVLGFCDQNFGSVDFSFCLYSCVLAKKNDLFR